MHPQQDHQTFILDHFFKRVDKSNKKVLPPSEQKVSSVFKKEKANIKTLLIEIPIGIIMNMKESIAMEHLRIDCNLKLSEIKDYIQQKYDVLNVYMYHDKEILN